MFVDVMGRAHPELKEEKLAPVDLSKVDLNFTFKYDATPTKEELGITFTPLEKMVTDTLDRLLELERQIPAK